MDQSHSNTIETSRKLGKHLTLDERGMIQALHQQGLILSILVDTLNSYKEDSYAAIGRAA